MKYFFCSNRNEAAIIEAEYGDNAIDMVNEGGRWTTRCSADTKEELIERHKISLTPCTKCGNIFSKATYGFKEDGLCFTCQIWNDVKKDIDNPKRIIVRGEAYWDKGNSAEQSKYRGHGGRVFHYKRFNSDDVISTNNLWHSGEVPNAWKDDIPDNAKFINAPTGAIFLNKKSNT